MVQHARLIFYTLLLLVIPCESTLAQKIPVTPIDSLITVGYATGSLKTLSGSVEKITETQMNKDQITNPLEAIRGRVPGLTIQRGSNGPAALDAVRLRGTTSLTSGNDPLIIVDGVFGDLSMLTSIYPTDIESFTILKDASETAQYGSRGASGVIEVTTKKGMSGRTQVAYNGSFGISTVYKNLKMLSGDEYRRVASERGISILDKGNNTDFQKTFYSAATFNPTYPNHKDPVTNSWDGITTASQITNPLAWMEVQDDDATSHISTHARLTFNLLEGLKLNLFGAYTYNIVENSQYLPTSVWANGQAYKGTKKRESLLGNMMLTYKKNWKKHFFDVLALAELQKETYTGYYTTVSNFSTDKFGYNNLQAGALRLWEGTNSYYDQPRLASFMGRFNYTYADRYVLTLNARTDASSKFGANHKWGFFPSASAAWVISEEEFMKQLPMVDNLKFRIGYGLAGNQSGIDSYTTLNLVKPNGVVPVGNSAVVSLGDLRNTNPDLKWEVKHTFNTGIDVALFGNRLLLSANYYNSRTTDMLYLYNVSVPPFTYNTLLANIGSMRNWGTEIAIGITPLKTKDMELNINANITFQRNKLLSLSGMYNGEMLSAPEYKSLAGLDGAGFHGGYNHIVYQMVGQPLGVFYLPHSTGLESDGNGGYTYGIADLNGGGVSLEDGEDRYVAGQAVPKTILGSNISFRYKRFDLSLQVNGAFGHKIYNGTSLTYMNMNIFPDYNVMKKAPKQNIKDQTATDYWLEKGDYVNFDYVTLGWNVPIEKVQKLKKYVRSLRLAFTVNNLATISGYSGLSPMINSSTVNSTLGVDDKRGYPLARTYTLGLSINF